MSHFAIKRTRIGKVIPAGMAYLLKDWNYNWPGLRLQLVFIFHVHVVKSVLAKEITPVTLVGSHQYAGAEARVTGF